MPPKKRRKKDYSKDEWKVERGRRYRKKKADAEKGKDWEGPSDRQGAGYRETVKENALFEKYYQGLGFISAEEWPTFLASLRDNLPVTFRITGTRDLAAHVLACLKKRFFVELAGLEVDGEKVPPPSPLPWYPGNLAWSVPLSKKFIRKSPEVSKFHSFLVRENEQGNISRQEAVSMIPPLLLDVKPAHKVLDMCAAPGSKTAQLIEFLHAEDTKATPMPEGVVIANDANNKRCYMLVHQAKRLNSPCLIVTNHDASVFPMLYYHDAEDIRHPIHYDRVLCDVPCSGDGTLRKNPSIWQSWNPLLGPSLHKLQLRILNRGLELLVPGGRLVYSTCSLNPVENEAVIATALSLCKGSVELVDCKESLTGLVTRPGVNSWNVMSKQGEWLESYSSIPKSLTKHFSPSMFPPENPDSMELNRCKRVLPHFQDTGGFFIAVLTKKDWLPWQSKMKAKRTAPSQNSQVQSVVEEEKGEEEGNNLRTSGSDEDPSMETGGDRHSSVKEISERENPGIQMLDSRSDDAVSAGQETGMTSEEVGGGCVGDCERGVSDVDPVPDPRLEGMTERPSAAILGKPDFQASLKRGFKEDPYVFFDGNSDFFDTIKPYYGLPEDFPLEQLLTRTRTGRKRNLYFSSRLIKELTLRNEHVLKIINIGVKVMSRCDHPQTPCSFRLCQEGVDSLVPYISKHCVLVGQEDLTVLLKEANPLITSLSPTAQEGLQTLGIGPIVFTYLPEEAASEAKGREVIPEGSEVTVCSNGESLALKISCPIHLSGWLAAKSARLFLDKNYRYHFLAMLGHDPPTNQCLDTISIFKSGRGNKGDDGEEGVSEGVTMKEDRGLGEVGVPGGVAMSEDPEEDCADRGEEGMPEGVAGCDMPGGVTMSEGEDPDKASGDDGTSEGVVPEGTE